jgi:hypothetical protein
MDSVGALLKQRYDQIVFESEMLKAGFAAFPYIVLTDIRLSPGARVAYGVLLKYGWQERACFPGQKKMAADIGVGERQVRNYLTELVSYEYIRIKRQGLNRPNLYYILDVKTKLKKGRNRGGAETDVRSGGER